MIRSLGWRSLAQRDQEAERVTDDARVCGDVDERGQRGGYRSPADAAHMDLPDGGIDLQTSYTVFEHIPGPVLAAILREANRLLSKGGVACHHIDPSDHFSHEDPAISAIHFLRYSEAEWDRYAGNQFAYHNRLRTHQYRRIYEECGHEILQWKEIVDSRSLAEIRGGFPLHEEFRPLAPEILSTVVVRAISRACAHFSTPLM